MLVNLRCTITGRFGGRPLSARIIVGQVWVRHEGSWREAYYQETPLDHADGTGIGRVFHRPWATPGIAS